MQFVNNFIMNLVSRLIDLRDEKHEEGQTLVEYALIIALVSIVLIASLQALAGGIDTVFCDIITTGFGGAC